MLQNPRKTLGFKKNMVYKIPPGGGGKPYPASGLVGWHIQQSGVVLKTGRTYIYFFHYAQIRIPSMPLFPFFIFFNIYTKCPSNGTLSNTKTHMRDATECINSIGYPLFAVFKVSKGAKIRNRYNQVKRYSATRMVWKCL